MARIYTRGGDKGETGLLGGGRIPKDHVRIEAVGAVDELNAAIGMAMSLMSESRERTRLETLQPDLFAIGSHLVAPLIDGKRKPRLPLLPTERPSEMEAWIDEMEAELPKLGKLIMPGGTRPTRHSGSRPALPTGLPSADTKLSVWNLDTLS